MMDLKPLVEIKAVPRSRPASRKPPNAVQRRNARERNRVKLVNDGFTLLRQHIPHVAKQKKLSKVSFPRFSKTDSFQYFSSNFEHLSDSRSGYAIRLRLCPAIIS